MTSVGRLTAEDSISFPRRFDYQFAMLRWQLEDVVVVDCDQGQSGASAADRHGIVDNPTMKKGQ